MRDNNRKTTYYTNDDNDGDEGRASLPTGASKTQYKDSAGRRPGTVGTGRERTQLRHYQERHLCRAGTRTTRISPVPKANAAVATRPDRQVSSAEVAEVASRAGGTLARPCLLLPLLSLRQHDGLQPPGRSVWRLARAEDASGARSCSRAVALPHTHKHCKLQQLPAIVRSRPPRMNVRVPRGLGMESRKTAPREPTTIEGPIPGLCRFRWNKIHHQRHRTLNALEAWSGNEGHTQEPSVSFRGSSTCDYMDKHLIRTPLCPGDAPNRGPVA